MNIYIVSGLIRVYTDYKRFTHVIKGETPETAEQKFRNYYKGKLIERIEWTKNVLEIPDMTPIETHFLPS